MNRDRDQLMKYGGKNEANELTLAIIEKFLEVTSRSMPRPDLTDKTIRKMLASELAGKIRRGL